MQIPRWLVFIVAAWVIIFGVFRIYLAVQGRKPADPGVRKRGLAAQSSRRNTLFGGLYLLLGSVLIAMGFGYTLPSLGQSCANDADTAEPAEGRSIDVSPGIETR